MTEITSQHPRPTDPVYICVSKRMIIRQYVPSDAPALFQLVEANREHLGSRLTWLAGYTSVADSELYIETVTAIALTNGAPTCGIWFDGILVGTVCFHPINHEIETTHLGYWIDHTMQGRGIVSAATRALIEYGFTELGLRRIEIVCAPDNKSSQAIATKLGFTREAKTQVAIWKHDPSAKMVVFAKEAA